MPGMVEELLRMFGSVQLVGRTVTTATEIGGSSLCPGDKVVLSVAAAGRDPSEFPDPNSSTSSAHPIATSLLGWACIAASGRTWPGWRSG